MFPNQWQAGLMWYLPQKNLKTFWFSYNCRPGSVVAYFVVQLQSVTSSESDAVVTDLQTQVNLGKFGGQDASDFGEGKLYKIEPVFLLWKYNR